MRPSSPFCALSIHLAIYFLKVFIFASNSRRILPRQGSGFRYEAWNHRLSASHMITAILGFRAMPGQANRAVFSSLTQWGRADEEAGEARQRDPSAGIHSCVASVVDGKHCAQELKTAAPTLN